MTNATVTSNRTSQDGTAITERQLPNVTSQVLGQIMKWQQSGTIELPPGYNAGNAINAARLVLENVKNASGKSIISNGQLDESVVTRNSVLTALHKYVSLGLNTDLDQAYFIVYGNLLQCQRSYHGEQALAKRIRPEIEFYSDTVRKGETLRLKKKWSNVAGYITVLEEHKFDPDRSAEIVGAYCGAVDTTTGEDLGLVYFSTLEIKKHWAVNAAYKENGNGFHQKWAQEMSVKVVIAKRAKMIYKSAPNSRLKAVIQRLDDDTIEAEVAEEAAQNANKEVLQIEAKQVDTATGEIVAADDGQGAGF